MVGLVQLAYAEAYELKAGGFRGAVKNKLTGEITKTEVFDTLEHAREAARKIVFDIVGDRNMAAGHYRSPRGEWRCNYFIRSDEVVWRDYHAN